MTIFLWYVQTIFPENKFGTKFYLKGPNLIDLPYMRAQW